MKSLLEMEGTAANSLAVNMSKLQTCTTIQEVVSFVKNTVPEDRLDQQKVKDLVSHIERSKNLVSAYSAVTNFILKSDNLGVVDKGKVKVAKPKKSTR